MPTSNLSVFFGTGGNVCSVVCIPELCARLSSPQTHFLFLRKLRTLATPSDTIGEITSFPDLVMYDPMLMLPGSRLRHPEPHFLVTLYQHCRGHCDESQIHHRVLMQIILFHQHLIGSQEFPGLWILSENYA